MRDKDLPPSENVEDRRGEAPAKNEPMTPLEAYEIAKRRPPPPLFPIIKPQPESPLAKEAGIDDIKPDDVKK